MLRAMETITWVVTGSFQSEAGPLSVVNAAGG